MLEAHEEAEAYDESGNSAEREQRFNPYHDAKTGQFASKGGGSDWHAVTYKSSEANMDAGDTVYAPEPRKYNHGITVGVKTYGKLVGILKTQQPQLEPWTPTTIRDSKNLFRVQVDEAGTMIN